MSDELTALVSAAYDDLIDKMYTAREEMAQRLLDIGIHSGDVEVVESVEPSQIDTQSGKMPTRTTYTVSARWKGTDQRH